MHTDGIFNYKLDFKSIAAELYLCTSIFHAKIRKELEELSRQLRALNKGSKIKLELIFGELTCKFYVHN